VPIKTPWWSVEPLIQSGTFHVEVARPERVR